MHGLKRSLGGGAFAAASLLVFRPADAFFSAGYFAALPPRIRSHGSRVLFGTGEPYVNDDSIDVDPALVLEGELGPVDLEEIETATPKLFQTAIVDPNRDLSGDYFGPLLPIAERIDSATGGWGLSYADLHPETPQTPIGQAFLATNACYACGGLLLGIQGEWTLGLLTEIAGVVSFEVPSIGAAH